ncbi:MAG: LytTR family DNA-binding domain-containing protein [Bacteroidales bacterium]|nr:LytTR family DNA-binding domain-containing protein [Bacteroidales bacterium]
MRVVIIDDEASARNNLVSLIESHFPELEILGEADGVQSGRKLIEETHPDLVFLDIQMQDGMGFDLVKLIDRSQFQVVFVSAYDHFAITAIKFSAVDYLLKPVEQEDMSLALEKIKQNKSDKDLKQKLDNLLTNINRIDKIALPSLNGMEFVKLNEIIRCESDNNYTYFYLVSGEKLLVSKTMKEYEDLLDGRGFFRTHKSHLINLHFMKKYLKGEGGTVIMEDGSEVLVSRRRKDEFMQILSKL